MVMARLTLTLQASSRVLEHLPEALAAARELAQARFG